MPDQENVEAKEFAPITTQEEFDRRIGERVARERAKFADYDDVKSQLTSIGAERQADAQKITELTEKLSGLEAEAAKRQADIDRLTVIAKHAVPLEYQHLVLGSTVEDLEKAATSVAELIQAKTAQPTGLPGPYVPGEGSTPPGLNSDALTERLKAVVGAPRS